MCVCTDSFNNPGRIELSYNFLIPEFQNWRKKENQNHMTHEKSKKISKRERESITKTYDVNEVRLLFEIPLLYCLIIHTYIFDLSVLLLHLHLSSLAFLSSLFIWFRYTCFHYFSLSLFHISFFGSLLACGSRVLHTHTRGFSWTYTISLSLSLSPFSLQPNFYVFFLFFVRCFSSWPKSSHFDQKREKRISEPRS